MTLKHWPIVGACLLWPSMMVAMQSIPSATDWTKRLESLSPAEPLDYFELAEEVADTAREGRERDLARHLFALAGALDPDRLGRSACLALADLEEEQLAKRRLLALAALLGNGSPVDRGGLGPAQIESGTSSALAACEALSHYRKGNGTQALSAIRQGAAQEILETHQRFIPGGFARFLEDCKHYRGQLRPTLSANEITRLLRFEAAILAGTEQTWENDLLLNNGKPLIEVDPMRLAESVGVDASKTVYRRGRWVEN